MPAVGRDHLRGNEPTTGHAQVETAEHAGHQQRLEALRGVFGKQRGGIGHAGTQPEAGQKAQHQQLVDVAGVGRGQAETTEHQYRTYQHDLAAKAVGQRPRPQGTEHHPDQCGAHHRAKAGAVDAPFLGQCRSDKAHGRSIQTIEEDNQEAKDHHAPLVARQRLFIDEGLNVEAVPDRLRFVHCCYPEIGHSRATARGQPVQGSKSMKCGLIQPGYNGTACGCGRSSEVTVVMMCASCVFLVRSAQPTAARDINQPMEGAQFVQSDTVRLSNRKRLACSITVHSGTTGCTCFSQTTDGKDRDWMPAGSARSAVPARFGSHAPHGY
ncbi:hypothetical protein D3C81_1121450 [compost metagenome]